MVAGPNLSVGAVARRADVTRVTVYNHFGSKAGLLQALNEQVQASPDPLPSPTAPAREQLHQRIAIACSTWASHAALLRHLPRTGPQEPGHIRRLAERLAASDQLRPGCSIKEAEDVIGTLTSFEVFEGLSKDGRRSPAAVAGILMRLASAILS